MKSRRWIAVSQPTFNWERDALDFLSSRLTLDWRGNFLGNQRPEKLELADRDLFSKTSAQGEICRLVMG
jgi:hypothetical protein